MVKYNIPGGTQVSQHHVQDVITADVIRPDATKDPYDVIVLGSGLAGSMLGAIVARAGFRVLLVDAGSHPKFAIGESTVGYTLVHLRMLAERYDVPEIRHMSNLPACYKHIGTTFGMKRHFGFIFHKDGHEPDPREVNQFRLPKVLHKAAHYFRQDTDAYLFQTAIRHGCDAKQNYRVADVDIDDDGVTVHGIDGTAFRGRYLVDGSGFRSPLATQLGLRDEPCRLKHHSRSIFTHMVGVEPTDDHVGFGAEDTPPLPWHHGTMHHMFDRGWFWIIPFDNHPQSTNPLCSVGLVLDPRTYPVRDDLTAEQEFWLHVDRFPMLKRQLTGARSAREWIRTGRLQYSTKRTVGDRWCMLSHAAGFIDPLFSRGLSNTSEILNALAWRLIDGLREDDLSAERFAYVEELERNLLRYNDELINCAFISFAHYDLWNAVFRIWSYGSLPGAFRVSYAGLRANKTGDHRYWAELENVANPGLWWPDNVDYRRLFDEMVECCEAVEAGKTDPADAAAQLHGRLAAADWVAPSLEIDKPDVRWINPNPKRLVGFLRWAHSDAPPEMREYVLGTAKGALSHFVRGQRVF